VTITVDYDLPYKPAHLPGRPALRAADASDGSPPSLPRASASLHRAAAPAGPFYFGRRPTRSGRSVPALFAGPLSSSEPAPAALCLADVR